MNKYFIYFSATGNGDFLASELKGYGYTPIKVEMVKPIKKVGFFFILRYGGRATFKKKDKIQPIELELKDDDLVIIGSPIWGDHLSTPINTVLKQLSLNKDTTRFVLYPAGEDTKKSLLQLAKHGFTQEAIVISNPLQKMDAAKELLKNYLNSVI